MTHPLTYRGISSLENHIRDGGKMRAVGKCIRIRTNWGVKNAGNSSTSHVAGDVERDREDAEKVNYIWRLF